MKKIALTGPESTGKTFLAEKLATYFHTVQRPEYARKYLEELGRNYQEEDLLEIAKGQLLEDEKIITEYAEKEFVFFDTELTVIKIWAEDKFGRCHPFVQSAWEQQNYDLYLLLLPDLPWEPDPQREDPHRREYLFGLYQVAITSLNVNAVELGGDLEQRFLQAVNIIKDLEK